MPGSPVPGLSQSCRLEVYLSSTLQLGLLLRDVGFFPDARRVLPPQSKSLSSGRPSRWGPRPQKPPSSHQERHADLPPEPHMLPRRDAPKVVEEANIAEKPSTGGIHPSRLAMMQKTGAAQRAPIPHRPARRSLSPPPAPAVSRDLTAVESSARDAKTAVSNSGAEPSPRDSGWGPPSRSHGASSSQRPGDNSRNIPLVSFVSHLPYCRTTLSSLLFRSKEIRDVLPMLNHFLPPIIHPSIGLTETVCQLAELWTGPPTLIGLTRGSLGRHPILDQSARNCHHHLFQ